MTRWRHFTEACITGDMRGMVHIGGDFWHAVRTKDGRGAGAGGARGRPDATAARCRTWRPAGCAARARARVGGTAARPSLHSSPGAARRAHADPARHPRSHRAPESAPQRPRTPTTMLRASAALALVALAAVASAQLTVVRRSGLAEGGWVVGRLCAAARRAPRPRPWGWARSRLRPRAPARRRRLCRLVAAVFRVGAGEAAGRCTGHLVALES